ncbi:hypothetical protein [Comamonas koreensis]|uniref:Arginase family protein n=1 Tax=Comamonas koreensis TaxID=160825 RepID=A0AAW4XQV4_9BURK|nr:hypothetical protein [Comamonas koreensis]MCD2163563.1 hypothetical protein [Comamonas koreensis]
MTPLVLDVDGSVGPLAGELRLSLGDWQEAIRFGASLGRYQQFRRHVQALLPQQHGTAWMGSGDFHHLSWLLIEHCIARQGCTAARPLRVVVLDNHPDNMRFPWGVHCGSWVRRIAMHPAVSHVHVAGITSPDIGAGHAWENYLGPLRAGKLSYWSCGVDTGWARRLGLSAAFRAFPSLDALTDALTATLARERQSSYLSIDKDVFAADVVTTNWDQGQMREAQAMGIIAALGGQLVGSDITGDVSSWQYSTWWKRWLSAGDGQDTVINVQALAQAQAGQHALNQRLMAALAAATLIPKASAVRP